jgi:RHS repeat-associated protein
MAPQYYVTQTATNYYFGSKLIKNGNANYWVYSDRLGSFGKFYPYGQERPTATTNGTEKFTGYFRDSESGNDYAVNRYTSPGMGRFITPDRGTGGAEPADPGTWNLYAYVAGDPINRVDHSGNVYVAIPAPGEGGGVDGSGCYDEDDDDTCGGLGGSGCVGGNGFVEQPGPLCPPVAGPTPSPLPDPAPAPQCPPYIKNFLVTMIPYANQLASTWSTNANDILALSALESGWLGQHAQALKNPYGLTNAGGNDLTFSTYRAATNFWSSNDGGYIQGITNITTFATTIQPYYNTANPAWASTIVAVYNSVLKRRAICGL